MKHYEALNEYHSVGPSRDIHVPALRMHLAADHSLLLAPKMTKGQLGRLHLLSHALQAIPELRELMGLAE